jgi:drug/metabolite transporter (DMT)-like permease
MSSGSRLALATAVITIWVTTGGNFLAFKGALQGFPPVLMMVLRLALAGGLLLVAAAVAISERPTPSQVGRGAVAGLLLLVLGQGGIVWGVQSLPAGRTAVFASSAPVFLAVFSAIRGQPLSRRALAGTGLGITGLTLLAVFSGGETSSLSPIAIILTGSAAWALGSIYAAEARLPKSPLTSGAVQTIAAALVLLPVAWVSGDFSRISMSSLGWSPVLSLLYLALFGLAIGYSLFAWVDRTSGPVLANTFHYVSPVIAMLAGSALLGEELTPVDVTAAAIALGGVALMVSERTPMKTGGRS